MNADSRMMAFFPKGLSRQESDILARRIRSQLEQTAFGLWAVEVVGACPFIGFVGLAEPCFEAGFTPCVEIGLRIAYGYWGKGIAFEAAQEVVRYAFDDLGLTQLVSFTASLNLHSQRLMQRLGFATLRSEDFAHPSLPDGHALRHHVLHRLHAQSDRNLIEQ